MLPFRATLFVSLLSCAAVPIAVQRADAPRLIEPRDYLGLFDIDSKVLAAFADDEPVDAAQRDALLKILFRLRQYSLAALDHFSLDQLTLAAIENNPADYRGELRALAGRVTRVKRETLDAAERERLGFQALFRCTIQTDTGQTVEVWTPTVPAAWKIGEPIDQRAGAKAMFLKRLPESGPLLFVAPRVGWYPDSGLGKLGMDLGLFDDVRDRTGLKEREAFYQMLAAVRRADQAELAREARQQLSARAKELVWQMNEGEVDKKQRAAARRELEQAEQGTSDIVPLFNEPAQQRGRLVVLRGEALRAVKIRVDDADVRARFGIDHYYEVDMVTGQSQNNPIVCIVATLPVGMPLGDNIHETVRVVGYFLKSWAFHTGPGQQTPAKQQLAPLVIAGGLQWLPSPPTSTLVVTTTAIGTVIGVAALAALTVWWLMRRADRGHTAATRAAREQLPERISFEE